MQFSPMMAWLAAGNETDNCQCIDPGGSASSGTLFGYREPNVFVELAAIGRCRDGTGANHEVAEALTFLALGSKPRKQWRQQGEDLSFVHILRIELGETRSVEGGTEIKIVCAGPTTDETDLGKIGARTSVRAARHADDDILVG